MAIISMKLNLYILKRLQKKIYKKLYSFYVININVKEGKTDHFGFGTNCYTIHHLWSSDSAGYPLIQTFMYNNSVWRFSRAKFETLYTIMDKYIILIFQIFFMLLCRFPCFLKAKFLIYDMILLKNYHIF